MTRAYYNEFDPYAAQWLRNLIEQDLIAAGDVDERSIIDVQPSDLEGYTQCHFFAGIGGWSLAARLAGWPDDRAIWTGSCPCQPFSNAGSRKGFDDERHLWPEFKRLISECRPTVVFGEQVASAAAWLANVRSDLEALEYAVGAIPVEAASAGADHLRDRFWFVADHDFERSGEAWVQRGGEFGGPGSDTKVDVRALSDMPSQRGHGGEGAAEQTGRFGAEILHIGGREYLQFPDRKWRHIPSPGVRWLGTGVPARVAKLRAFGNAIDPRPAAQVIGAYLDIAA
ncbi:DNA cytosine methyltransferase [Pelagibacterium flavum]|uniref:DNA cytosine methyltransferase n=1 Tax=Pelagibacterium flavum TaxID=2984530 RepID=A0ABY6INW9_9HYPH|nr:DNA cytosine methyltransferase [Pelagibacterium sp. YIM 151497]UYQ71002.1 DNA cytosine methyltransferase [Pelagibacterium sp. YIM 151497]